MYDDFDDTSPARSPSRKLIYALIVLLLIVGLLASSVVTLWQLTRGASETATELFPGPTATLPIPRVGAGEDLATPSAVPTEDSDNVDRIAYIDPAGRVATISPDGKERRTITGGPSIFQFPAWSPDGQYLAVIGRSASGTGVYLLTDDAASRDPREMYASRIQTPFYLYWSPDGRQLSFLANHPTEVLGMHLVPIDDPSKTRLLATGSPFYWDWTAAGDRVLIHSGFSGAEAHLEFVSTTRVSDAEEIGRPGFFQAPGISSSGRYLAYAEETFAGESQLVVADTVTGQTQRERHLGLVAMGWSPVGDQLAVISASENETQFHGPLRVVDVGSQEVRLLSRDKVLAFFWSPDGRYLVVISASSRESDINVGLPGNRSDRQPALARTAGRDQDVLEVKQVQQQQHLFKLSVIEVTSGRTNHFSFFQPSAVLISQFLPFFDQYALSHIIWSPHSDAFVFPMFIDGANRIVVTSVESGETRQIADGDMPFWSPR